MGLSIQWSKDSKCQRTCPNAQVIFKHLLCIMFANVPLAKANHTVNPNSKVGKLSPPFDWKIYNVTLQEAGKRRISGYFYNLPQNGSQLFCWVFSNVGFYKSFKKISPRKKFSQEHRFHCFCPNERMGCKGLTSCHANFLLTSLFILMSHTHLCLLTLN